MQGVELTGTNRSCGLVVLLFHLLRSKSTRPGSSAASAARHDTFACAYAKGFTFSGGYIGRQSSHRTGWCPMQSPTFSGGYIGGVPPVPIPNTAVKPSRADGTARFPCGRVGRCRNFFPDAPPRHHTRRGASLFQGFRSTAEHAEAEASSQSSPLGLVWCHPGRRSYSGVAAGAR